MIEKFIGMDYIESTIMPYVSISIIDKKKLANFFFASLQMDWNQIAIDLV